MNKKFLLSLIAGAIAVSCIGATASAHGIFIANRLDQKALVLGEGPGDNAYNPTCVLQWKPMIRTLNPQK